MILPSFSVSAPIGMSRKVAEIHRPLSEIRAYVNKNFGPDVSGGTIYSSSEPG